MARRNSGRLTSLHLLTSLVAFAIALGSGSAATAARLSEVRVGSHEDHTRIVLELDAPASYRVVSQGGDTKLELALDASSPARQVPSKSPLVRGVEVEPDGSGSTVRVDLAKGGVEITEMILSNPPRIVLDLKRVASTAQASPPPSTEPAPAPAPTPAAPAVAAKSEPAPPAPAQSQLADKPATDVKPSAAVPSLVQPLPKDLAAQPAPRPTVPVTDSSQASVPEEKPFAAPPPPAPAPPVAQTELPAPAELVVRKPKPTSDTAGSLPASPREALAKVDAETGGSSLDRLMSPTALAVIGGLAVAGLVLFVVRRRRAAEDDDPLYSVMAADDAGAGEVYAQDEDTPAARWAAREAEEAERAVADPHAYDADEPTVWTGGRQDDDAAQLSLARAAHLPVTLGEPEEPGHDADDSIFDAPSAADLGSTVAAPAAPPAASGSLPVETWSEGTPLAAQATIVAAELEGRIRELERRLEQLSESRERVERQVAAQTEELRVQRAAIARTQRVVRSMTKSEDLATEPVPRVPSG